MNFSSYDPKHKCYDKTNKKVLGKFMDEEGGKTIANFIALKPESYCFRTHNEDQTCFRPVSGRCERTISNLAPAKSHTGPT